jgi:hypothetical protein
MKANLYFHPATFRYNGKDTEQEVAQKLKELVRDMAQMSRSAEHMKNNMCWILTELFECKVFEEQTFLEFAQKHLDPDELGNFYALLANQSEEYSSDMSMESLLQMCQFRPDEQEVNSLVVLNRQEAKANPAQYITFDDYKLVYNRGSWLTLRRQILGNHPGTPSEFMKECKLYFEDLVFSDACEASLKADFDYLRMIPRKIVYYLSCLNDGYRKVYGAHQSSERDINATVTDFSGLYNLDKAGSREGNPSKKEDLKFEFYYQKTTMTYHCEPHLKINTPDDNYAGSRLLTHFNPRIYFYPNECLKPDGKIFVGSIGKHL